jgi:hypothetical protein
MTETHDKFRGKRMLLLHICLMGKGFSYSRMVELPRASMALLVTPLAFFIALFPSGIGNRKVTEELL